MEQIELKIIRMLSYRSSGIHQSPTMLLGCQQKPDIAQQGSPMTGLDVQHLQQITGNTHPIISAGPEAHRGLANRICAESAQSKGKAKYSLLKSAHGRLVLSQELFTLHTCSYMNAADL